MIGEVIKCELYKHPISGFWKLEFIIIVDGTVAYASTNVMKSQGLLLLEAVAGLWWAPPERFVGKLYPMKSMTFNGKIRWSLDWIQMREMAKYWKEQDEARESASNG